MHERCNAPTRDGTACRWPVDRCPVASHRAWREAQGRVAAAREAPAAAAPRRPAIDLAALEGRDLRELAWAVTTGVLRGEIDAREGSVVASLLRVLVALDPTEGAGEEALREIELRGRLMHGLPPRDEEEWAFAARIFSDDALAEFRRWAPSVDADRGDGPEPFPFRDAAAVEVEVPPVVDDEDGGLADLR